MKIKITSLRHLSLSDHHKYKSCKNRNFAELCLKDMSETP